jgi:hypothetical protein
MNTQQENKLSMYLAVLAACEPHLQAIRSLPAMGEAHAEFARHVSNIQRLAQLREINNTGLTADKRHLRNTMAESAATIALAIRAYACKSRNNELAAKSAVTASRMTVGRDTVAAGVARNVHSLATEHQKALIPFGITPEKISQLGASIDAYVTSIGKPRAATVQSATLTSQLASEFESADDILIHQLDGLIEQFRSVEAGPFESYQNARALVRLRAGRTKPSPGPVSPSHPDNPSR